MLEASTPVHFDAAGCVHPERPQGEGVAVLDNESFTDPEPEASSLHGSVIMGMEISTCVHLATLDVHHMKADLAVQDEEYAFVYERPAGVEDPPKHEAEEVRPRPVSSLLRGWPPMQQCTCQEPNALHARS